MFNTRPRHRWSLCVLWLMAASAQAQSPQTLPTVGLSVGMHRIEAMVADSPEERAIGLMHRLDMADHQGMIFVFDTPGVQCFWMRNTPLPLTAAFVADDGRVVNLADMKPFDESSHCSKEPVRYVLEVHQGWFAKRGFKAGTTLKGLPRP